MNVQKTADMLSCGGDCTTWCWYGHDFPLKCFLSEKKKGYERQLPTVDIAFAVSRWFLT